jgi:hypothetical protein
VLPECYRFSHISILAKGAEIVELAIYARQKNEAGEWRYQRIEQGPGRKNGHLEPPFYFRPTLPNGKRSWIELKARSFAEAKAEIPSLEATCMCVAYSSL